MYRLLIVDDEELIVHGLSEILSSQTDLDLDIYKAYSGREAEEWLDRTRMDLVLTDIRMPEMDGIGLLEEIRKRWPKCHVIILTGYDEFDYVYRAIQSPNTSYLLKTEDPMKVIEKVREAIYALQREMRTEDLLRKAKEQMTQANGFYQQNYFEYILRGHTVATRETLEELGVPLRVELPLLMTLCSIEESPAGYMEGMRRMQSVREIIARSIMPTLTCFFQLNGYNQLLLFAQPSSILGGTGMEQSLDDEAYQKALSFLSGTLEMAQAMCRDTLSMPVSFVVAANACGWNDIPNQAAQLNRSLACGIGEGIETFLIYDEHNDHCQHEHSIVSTREGSPELYRTLGRKDLTEMEQMLMVGRAEPFYELLLTYLQPLYSIKSKHDPLALEAYFTVALALLSYINRWDMMEKVSFRLAQYNLTKPELFDSWAEAADYLRELAGVLIALQCEEQHKRVDKTIAGLQMFIQEHLAEDLSLVRLSEQVHLNPSYLSRLYRQTTGVNLSVYIEGVRIAQAKELLLNGGMRIQDIARKIGYDNTTSFTRLFKKNTGRTPQEFRECQETAQK